VASPKVWRWTALGLVFVLLIVLAAMGLGGIAEVKDHEVALIVNYVTGSMEVDTVPGNKIFIPFVHEVFTFDKSPNKFLMEGKVDLDTDHVRELTVRASDGSNFWFESLEIQYQLLPTETQVIVNDSGTGDAFKKFWLMAYARSVLRDEFGKFDPEGISNPSSYSKARVDSQLRLNTLLKPHGLEIIQITTPKPKFVPDYEKAIEDRKLAEQEVERLKAKALQLRMEKAKRLAEIESTRGQEFAGLKGQLAASLTKAEAEKIKLEREADSYKIERTGAGEAERVAKIEEARGMTETYRKQAQGLEAQILALAGRGRPAVLEAFAKRLAEIPIEILPYQRNQAPSRIELESPPKTAPVSDLLPKGGN
jgi:membrane protease subunit HflC